MFNIYKYINLYFIINNNNIKYININLRTHNCRNAYFALRTFCQTENQYLCEVSRLCVDSVYV